MKSRGFTLIELMIMTAITLIIFTIFAPILIGESGDTNEAEPTPEQQKFEQFVDDDCVRKYGKFACEYN